MTLIRKSPHSQQHSFTPNTSPVGMIDVGGVEIIFQQ